MRLFSLEKSLGDIIKMYKYLKGRSKEDCHSPLSGTQWQDKGQSEQTKVEGILFKHIGGREKKLFYFAGGPTLAQSAQRCCSISILGDNSKPN